MTLRVFIHINAPKYHSRILAPRSRNRSTHLYTLVLGGLFIYVVSPYLPPFNWRLSFISAENTRGIREMRARARN